MSLLLENAAMYAHREDANGEEVKKAGFEIHSLWFTCGGCGAMKNVARWKDMGGVQVGSLNCDGCGADLVARPESETDEQDA